MPALCLLSHVIGQVLEAQLRNCQFLCVELVPPVHQCATQKTAPKAVSTNICESTTIKIRIANKEIKGRKENSKKEHLQVGSKLASGTFSCAPISPSLKRPVADLQPATDKVGSLRALHASITLPCAAPLDAMPEARLPYGASCTPHVYQLASAYHPAA
jgi:hypothetical protein